MRNELINAIQLISEGKTMDNLRFTYGQLPKHVLVHITVGWEPKLETMYVYLFHDNSIC